MSRFLLASVVGVVCSLSCGVVEEEERLVETVSQSLTVECDGVTGVFGRAEYAAVLVTYDGRPETVISALSVDGGPRVIACTDDGFGNVSAEPVRFQLHGLARDKTATISLVIYGRGPCDDPDGDPTTFDGDRYPLFLPIVINCDLTQPPPIDCSDTDGDGVPDTTADLTACPLI